MTKNINDSLGRWKMRWNMVQTLVYFCGKNDELLPTKESFFLTEFVCTLDELLTGKEQFRSFRDFDYKDWGHFLNKELSSILISVLKTETKKKIFSNQLICDLKEMTNLTWNNDDWGDGEYGCLFLSAYKGIVRNSGWYYSTFKLQPKEKSRLKGLVSMVSPEFLEFCQRITPIIRKYVDNDINPENRQLKGYCW